MGEYNDYYAGPGFFALGPSRLNDSANVYPQAAQKERINAFPAPNAALSHCGEKRERYRHTLSINVNYKIWAKTVLLLITGLLTMSARPYANSYFTQPISASSYAKDNLTGKIQDALKLPAEKVDDRLFDLCRTYIMNAQADSATVNADQFISAIAKSELDNKVPIIDEIRALQAKKLAQLQDAKRYILQALNAPSVRPDQLPRMLSILAFIDTDLENYSAAMKSYYQLDKLLAETQNNKVRILNFINTADLYNKGGLYQEAIQSLDKAQRLIGLIYKQQKSDALIMVYTTKALAYFYLNRLDSLEFYFDKVTRLGSKSAIGAIAFHRLKYMTFMLKKDPAAIGEIKAILGNPGDEDKLMTSFQLAQAYLEFNQSAQAKAVILKMLHTGDIKNLVYLSSKLYAFLGKIYDEAGDFKSAAFYYKKSVERLSINAENQLQADNIMSAFRYFDMNDKYAAAQKDLSIKRNYLILIFLIGILLLLLFFFLYRALRAKKALERVRFDQFNYELSMMSSHEVRRYLANVLGIILVIKISDDKCTEFLEMEDALYESADKLDLAILEIVKKLNQGIRAS